MAPRLRSAGSTSVNDSSLARSDGASKNGSRPASIKSSPPSVKNAAAQGGQSDDENDEASPLPGGDAVETAAADTPSDPKDDRGDNDRVSLPASSFERAAHRASRQGKAAGPSSSSRLSSEYDSEDIIVAPRHSQRESTPQPRSSTMSDGDLKAPESSSPPNSGDTSSGNKRNPNGSSSDLSDLGATPEPEDSELVRLAGEERRRKLDLCECEGWCTCERYKIFYGFAPHDEESDAGSDRSPAYNEEAGTGTKRKRVPEDAAIVAKKPRTSTTSTQDEDYENDSGFLDSSQSKSTSDSNNRSHDAADLSDSDLPSQTHLSERVLANEQLPESSMRSTITSVKRRNVFDDDNEHDVKKTRTEQVYSWDRGDKPMRPPAGWVGGEWIGGFSKGKGKARMI
jgi:hypothetical protein